MPEVDLRSAADSPMRSAGSPRTASRTIRGPTSTTASLRRRFPHLAGVETWDLRVDGPHGLVPARVYRDDSAAASGQALVWVHGGAFIGGHLDMPESHWVALELAARGIPVVAVDYTKCLGDVHFPVPSDDVLAAWRHVAGERARTSSASIPTSCSSGARAPAATSPPVRSARLRDAGEPLPAGLVLVYPALHPNGPEASVRVRPGVAARPARR